MLDSVDRSIDTPQTGFQSGLSSEQTKTEIHKCLEEWVAAVNSGSPDRIAALYDPEALLLATFNPKPLTTPEERKTYFVELAKRKGLRTTVDEDHVHIFSRDAGAIGGLYTFDYMADNGRHVEVKARFSFIFARHQGGWKIVSHHSSRAPSPDSQATPRAQKRAQISP